MHATLVVLSFFSLTRRCGGVSCRRTEVGVSCGMQLLVLELSSAASDTKIGNVCGPTSAPIHDFCNKFHADCESGLRFPFRSCVQNLNIMI
jgi:hypothetical protein